ncbi:MAG: riboflavin synthase [candidate division WOR-3 bacterium]|nr:riboflavin synthase [candidate division WOR-3 bacterium]
MFTGLVEETGIVRSIDYRNANTRISIGMSEDFISDIKRGDSIAIDGLCLTAEMIEESAVTFTALSSTVSRSIIKSYRKGIRVNLEKAVKPSTRLGGHIVDGHVDETAKVRKFIHSHGSVKIEIALSSGYGKYLVENDSIAVNGVSLTIKEVFGNNFTVEIIPETISLTNIDNIKVNDYVNVEINHISKSVYQYIKGVR